MSALLLFALAAAGSPPADTTASRPAPVAGKITCKTETRIGTLAGRKRVCHTEAEWREIARVGRKAWEEAQGTHGSSHSLEPLPETMGTQPTPQ